MTLERVRLVLDQAKELETVECIYFSGGEPFLHYPVLLSAVRMAARYGMKVGVISNGYWATDEADCAEWLGPLAGLVHDLTISADWYHWEADLKQHVRNACTVAQDLGIPVRVVSVVYPECLGSEEVTGAIPVEESPLMYRGRAAKELSPDAPSIRLGTYSCVRAFR
jgi:pyruvate-formate lyase-activating enzyme